MSKERENLDFHLNKKTDWGEIQAIWGELKASYSYPEFAELIEEVELSFNQAEGLNDTVHKSYESLVSLWSKNTYAPDKNLSESIDQLLVKYDHFNVSKRPNNAGINTDRSTLFNDCFVSPSTCIFPAPENTLEEIHPSSLYQQSPFAKVSLLECCQPSYHLKAYSWQGEIANSPAFGLNTQPINIYSEVADIWLYGSFPQSTTDFSPNEWFEYFLQVANQVTQKFQGLLSTFRYLKDLIVKYILVAIRDRYSPRVIGKGIEGYIPYLTWARPPSNNDIPGYVAEG